MPGLVIRPALGVSLLFPTRSGGMLPEGLCHATPRPPAKEGGLVTEEGRVGDLGKGEVERGAGPRFEAP